MLRVLVHAGTLLLLCALASAQELEWWKTATFYQVYPRSLKDSNSDGTGDLQGIISKLDHLVDIGIGGVWLSPIFKSPMKDFGYDISDFRDIDPIFGNMADFDELVLACNEKGLKLIMDFVPNHSSNEHAWFLESVKKNGTYSDYYTWRDPAGYTELGAPIPPNNWLSVFGGSAWQWNPARQQFYLHQFVAGQPDLNFRHPPVLQEMLSILEFWLDKGVDGFRIDAVPHLMEDQSFPDEPPSNNPEFTSDQWGSLRHDYTVDLPELYDVILEFRKTIDAKQEELGRPLVMMVEAYTTIENTMKYYGNETHPGAHFPFNFQMISNLDNSTRAQGLYDTINTWMVNMPEGAWANWVIGNHDQPRVASRFGRDFSLAAIMMSQLLPGTAFTYNGEEINMENTWISWQDTVDPQGCQAGPEYYEKFSRDPTRTPFQWSADNMAGFTDGDTTWLPVNPNYETLNLEVQKAAEKSAYKVYKLIVAARKMKAAREGEFKMKVIKENVFAFVRELDKDDKEASLLVVVNVSPEKDTVNVGEVGDVVPGEIQFYAGSLESPLKAKDTVMASKVEVPARGGLVFLYNSAPSVAASAFLIALAALLKFL